MPSILWCSVIMRSRLLVGLVLGVVLAEARTTAAEKPAIIPQPASMTVKDGSFALVGETTVYRDSQSEKVARMFARSFLRATGFDLAVHAGGAKSAGICLVTDGADPTLGDEGYTLTVTPNRVVIRASKPAGLFYGVQTLLQLLPPEIELPQRINDKKDWNIPCVEISDRPRFAWRGLLLDVSRHFFSKDEVKQYIDRMVRYKFNLLQLHLTDDQGWRIEIKKYPKLTEIGAWRVPRVGDWWSCEPPQPGEKAAYGGFYTQDDIRELVAYAQERFVTLLPEIECPGHAMAALASYPELSCTGGPFAVNPGSKFYKEIDNTYCPGKEVSFAMLNDIFGEVATLFPGLYIHIGGDEAFKGFWEKCPDCKKRMQAEGLKNVEELQSYFVKRIEKIVESKGKRLIGWDEILEGGLAPNATVMSWRGMDGGAAAAKMNHQVVMSPVPECYLDLYQGNPAMEPNTYGMNRLIGTYCLEPVPKGVDPKWILGIQGNLWSESIPALRHAEYMTWPRAFAIAETAWSPKAVKNWPDFVRRVESQFLRFDAADRKYARSMYDVIVTPKRRLDKKLVIELSTEVPDLAIYYTFAGPDPDSHYPKYESPLLVPKNATTVRAIAYRNGKPVGRIVTVPIKELEKLADSLPSQPLWVLP